jgi:hypothetical protein
MREPDEPDTAGSTAQFRAFAARYEGRDSTQPWSMRAPRNRIVTLAAVVVGVAVLLGLVARLVIR